METADVDGYGNEFFGSMTLKCFFEMEAMRYHICLISFIFQENVPVQCKLHGLFRRVCLYRQSKFSSNEMQ